MMLLLLAVAAIVPAVSGFGGGKSTVFISCDANSPASPTTHLEAAITQLLPLDPPLILNATCDFKSLALQSYTNIIVNINGGSTSSYDIKALADLFNAGKRVIMVGGSGTSSFQSSMDKYLLKTGDSSYTWTPVGSIDKAALTMFHSDHPLNKGMPSVVNQTEFLKASYMLRVADSDARIASLNGAGFPAFVSKANGENGVFVYYAGPLDDVHLNATAATPGSAVATMKIMIRNALKTEPSKFSDQLEYKIFENSIGKENFDMVQTSSYSQTNWDAAYSTIVVLMNGGSVGSSDIQELGRFVKGGTRLLLFGGSGTSSFVTGVNSYLLTTGSTSYSWVSVGADKPAMTVWHEDHPLNKNLPPLINQTDLANVNYVTQVSDINARVAARNGDGYPCLVSKAFGTDGGVLVYYTDPPKDKDLLGEGPAYIKTILDNAISTPTSTMTAGTRRKAVLLVETVSSSVNPNVFTLLEQQLDPDNTDLLQTTNWDATGVWAAYYRTIVIAVNGGSPSSTSIKNVEKLVSAGVRVVMLGGSNYLLATGDSTYTWQTVRAGAPALSVWSTKHPLVKNLPSRISQTEFLKA
eukprot:gene13253-8371_t